MFTFNPSKYDNLNTYKRLEKKLHWYVTIPGLRALLLILVVYIGISLMIGWTIFHTIVLLFLVYAVVGQVRKKRPSNYNADSKDESQGICTVNEKGIHYKSEIQTFSYGWHSIQAIRRKKGIITITTRAFLNQPAHNYYWFIEILRKQDIDIDELHAFILRHLYEKVPALNIKRLRIKPLQYDELGQLMNGSVGDMVGQFSLTGTLVAEVPREIIKDKQKKLEFLTDWRWMWNTYFLVGEIKKSRAMGLIGFKSEPIDGVAELAEGVGEVYRNNKNMVEALNGLIGWAVQTGRCNRIVANMDRKKVSIQKALKKCGFFYTGEAGDTIYYQKNLTQ